MQLLHDMFYIARLLDFAMIMKNWLWKWLSKLESLMYKYFNAIQDWKVQIHSP